MAVEAVVGETQDGQRALRSHLQGVDLARDAHDLRWAGARIDKGMGHDSCDK